MMKPYLFTYSQMCPGWHAQAILSETNAVKNWVQPFPNAVIVLSDLDAYDLAAVLRVRLGETWFLVTELSSATVDGFLPGNLWQFVNNEPNASLCAFPAAPPRYSPRMMATEEPAIVGSVG